MSVFEDEGAPARLLEFYDAQLALGDAFRSPGDWKRGNEFWRWAAIGLSLGIVSTDWLRNALERERVRPASQDEVKRFAKWIHAEACQAVNRLCYAHRILPGGKAPGFPL